MIIKKIEEIVSPPIFMHVNFLSLEHFFIKIEGLNIAGSIKMKTAKYLLNSLEERGILSEKSKIIESSSGNLGIALAIICKSKGYPFYCVVDPNISPQSENLMRAYGTKIIKVQKRDGNGGFLGTRIDLIKDLLSKDKYLVWTNQYSSLANPQAHYEETASEILEQFNNVDYVFIGTGTSGTLVGVSKYIKEQSPNTKIIAVDSIGSVTFGYPAATRYIPGLGTSQKPSILSTKYTDEIVVVDEKDAVFMCNYCLKKHGLFLGGSSGSVLFAVYKYFRKLPKNSLIVAISPDFGDKYISTIYNSNWCHSKSFTKTKKNYVYKSF